MYRLDSETIVNPGHIVAVTYRIKDLLASDGVTMAEGIIRLSNGPDHIIEGTADNIESTIQGLIFAVSQFWGQSMKSDVN